MVIKLSKYLIDLAVIKMDLSEMLKILADETRFKIIEFLLERDYCVGALARRLGISDAAVSQHLQILRKGGLLKGEKRGYWTHYSVERDMLNEMAEKLMELANSAADRQSGCWRDTSGKIDGRRNSMCKCNCEHPEKLKDTSGKCSDEQIKECHGEQATHLCEKKEAE